MTRCAVVNDTHMVEHCGHKCTAGHVADVTVIGCRHMRRISLCALARCVDTVVARFTPLTHNIGPAVINKRVEETCRVMAYSTVLCCRNVVQ